MKSKQRKAESVRVPLRISTRAPVAKGTQLATAVTRQTMTTNLK
jgi:hypothetical protein